MHNVLIISYIAFPIGKLFILPESNENTRQNLKQAYKKSCHRQLTFWILRYTPGLGDFFIPCSQLLTVNMQP